MKKRTNILYFAVILIAIILFLYAYSHQRSLRTNFISFSIDSDVYICTPSEKIQLSKTEASEIICLLNSYSQWQNGTSDCASSLLLLIGEESIQLHDDHCNLLTQELSLTFNSEDSRRIYDILSTYSFEIVP